MSMLLLHSHNIHPLQFKSHFHYNRFLFSSSPSFLMLSSNEFRIFFCLSPCSVRLMKMFWMKIMFCVALDGEPWISKGMYWDSVSYRTVQGWHYRVLGRHECGKLMLGPPLEMDITKGNLVLWLWSPAVWALGRLTLIWQPASAWLTFENGRIFTLGIAF